VLTDKPLRSRPRLVVTSASRRPGAAVDVDATDGLDVEFVLASRRTQALISFGPSGVRVRAVADGDLIAVRELKRTA
jgi:hypothetical protein